MFFEIVSFTNTHFPTFDERFTDNFEYHEGGRQKKEKISYTWFALFSSHTLCVGCKGSDSDMKAFTPLATLSKQWRVANYNHDSYVMSEIAGLYELARLICIQRICIFLQTRRLNHFSLTADKHLNSERQPERSLFKHELMNKSLFLSFINHSERVKLWIKGKTRKNRDIPRITFKASWNANKFIKEV